VILSTLRLAYRVPDPSTAGVQKVWDTPVVNQEYEEVLSAAQNQTGRARLIAVAAPHSGDFLNSIPCSSVGSRLDDTSLRIAVLLRLGATICAPHTCICGMQVDSSGVHGLTCRKSAGRHMRHNAVNYLIKQALASANVLSVFEPIFGAIIVGVGAKLIVHRRWKTSWRFDCALG